SRDGMERRPILDSSRMHEPPRGWRSVCLTHAPLARTSLSFRAECVAVPATRGAEMRSPASQGAVPGAADSPQYAKQFPLPTSPALRARSRFLFWGILRGAPKAASPPNLQDRPPILRDPSPRPAPFPILRL